MRRVLVKLNGNRTFQNKKTNCAPGVCFLFKSSSQLYAAAKDVPNIVFHLELSRVNSEENSVTGNYFGRKIGRNYIGSLQKITKFTSHKLQRTTLVVNLQNFKITHGLCK